MTLLRYHRPTTGGTINLGARWRRATNQPMAEEIPWQAEHVRLTTFVTGEHKVDQTTWATIVGEEPESHAASPKKGELQAEGPFGDGRLVLKIAPGRIDWLYTPNVDPEATFQMVGPAQQCLDAFLNVTGKWWSKAPPIERIALGGVFLVPGDDKLGSYKILKSYVGNALPNAEDYSDFHYQINRRTTIGGIEANRLTKWAVMAVKRVQLVVGGVEQVRSIGDMVHAVRHEIDFNTVPEHKGPIADPGLLLKEFVAQAADFRKRGVAVIM